MKNLKRALSFALATVMLIGMMVVGASAAGFEDADKIVNTDAVNTMVALGIIKGKGDGTNFDPEGIVTRAEMAKMICVALNGGKDPNLAGGGLYPDTKGHWASGYIDYCTNLGIVAGDTAGNFNPDKTVTGTEAAKMILIALGYNAENEKFVNDANWSLNINIVANSKGLYQDLAILPAEGLTRDNAAQMLWNGMDANLVEYDYKLTTVNGDLQTVAIAKDKAGPVDLLFEKFDMVRAEDVILTKVALDTKGTYTLGVNGAASSYTKVVADYTSLLGQKVDVLYKRGYTDKVYGVYATTDNSTFTYNMSAATNDGGEVKVDNTKYELDSCVTITDGVYSGTAVGAGSLVGATSYNTVTLVDNDADDKYEVAVITTVSPAKVTYVSEKEIIAGGTTYKFADHNIADGLAKGDYVTVIYNIAKDNNDIAKLDVINGKVDATKDSGVKVRVDGTWYHRNGNTMALDSTYDFVAVNGVVVNADVASTASISNLVMVVVAETGNVRNQAKVLFADGTKDVVNIDSDGVVPTAGNLYTYTETDNGFKFKAAADIGDYDWNAANTVNTSSGKIASIDGDSATTYSIADNAVIFVRGTVDNSAIVLTGKQLKTLGVAFATDGAINPTSNGLYVTKINGLDRIVFAAVTTTKTGKLNATNGNEIYGYVTSNYYTVSDSYTTYTIWNGEENLTVIDKSANTLSKGAIITYDSIDGDYIKGVNVVTPTYASAVYGTDGKKVYMDGAVDGTNDYKLTSDTVYMYVDTNASKAADMGKAGGELALADKFEGGIYRKNVIFTYNGSREIEFILIDVKNELAGTHVATYTGTAPTIATATVTLSKTTGIKAGDLLTITVKAGASATTATTLNLANCLTETGTATLTIPVIGANQTKTFTVVATGAGAVSFS